MPYTKIPPRGLTTIIALMTMIGPFTIDAYLPSFPDIEAEYGISRALLSQSLGFYLAAFAIATLVLGPLADRLGRRWVIFISLLFYVAASIGCAQSDTYEMFLFFRIMQGAAAAGGLVTGRAMIRDVYPPKEAHRAMARVMMLFAIAPAIAPIIGGWLHDLFGWHSVFYFLAIYASAILLLVFIQIPETLAVSMRQSFHPVNVARVYGHTLIHRRFQSLIFIMGAYFGGMFIYIAGAPSVIFDFLNLGVSDFYVLFVPLVAGLMCGAWISGRLSHQWPMERTVKLALSLMLLGSLLNTVQAQWLEPMVITAVAPLVLYTCGIGIAMPAMTVLSLDCFPKNRGTASALQGFVQMMVNAFVSSIAVPLLIYQPSWLAMGQLSILIIALLLWWRLPAVSEHNI